jgi:hypothetical protein
MTTLTLDDVFTVNEFEDLDKADFESESTAASGPVVWLPNPDH